MGYFSSPINKREKINKMDKTKNKEKRISSMKVTRSLIILLMFLILTINISALEINNFAPVKQGQCTTVKQTCASCTHVNTSIFFPNSTIAVTNQGMSDQGGGTWTYEFCNTSDKGRYDVTGSGDLLGTETGFDVLYFEVSATGTELTQAKAISYTIILIISILIFFGLLFIGIKLPSKNKSDELTGYIIAVSNLKYVKTFILGLSYLSIMWIGYFTWMITHAFLDFNFLSSMFKIIFYTLAISTFPLFILYIYFTIVNFIRDKDIKDLLLRGLSTK